MRARCGCTRPSKSGGRSRSARVGSIRPPSALSLTVLSLSPSTRISPRAAARVEGHDRPPGRRPPPPAGQDRRRRQPGPHAADPARCLLSRPPRRRAGPAWKLLSWPAAAPARPPVPCPEAPPAGVPTPARLLRRQAVGAAPPFPSLHRSPPLLKVNPLLFPVDPCWIVHPCSCVKDIWCRSMLDLLHGNPRWYFC